MSLRISIFESAKGTTGFAFGLGVCAWFPGFGRTGMNHEDAKGTKLWDGLGRTACGMAGCWGAGAERSESERERRWCRGRRWAAQTARQPEGTLRRQRAMVFSGKRACFSVGVPSPILAGASMALAGARKLPAGARKLGAGAPPFHSVTPPFLSVTPPFLSVTPPFHSVTPPFHSVTPPFLAAKPPFLALTLLQRRSLSTRTPNKPKPNSSN